MDLDYMIHEQPTSNNENMSLGDSTGSITVNYVANVQIAITHATFLSIIYF